MNKVFIKSNNSLKSIFKYVLLSLLPLIIYGFYKNGIKLFIQDYVSIYGLVLPLIFDFLGLIIGLLANIIYDKLITKNFINIKTSLYSSFHPIYGLLIASIISINTNLLLFIIISFTCLFISKFLKKNNLNIIALSALLIILLTDIFGTFTYLNLYEQSKVLNLVGLDYFLGMGSGGINTTCVLLLIISLLILCNKNYYKKEIPLYSSLVYIICIIIYSIFTQNIANILNNIFSNGILFSFVFIATDPLSSSYTAKGKIIYSMIIGLATFGLFLICPPLSALGGILIASICHNNIDKAMIK